MINVEYVEEDIYNNRIILFKEFRIFPYSP